MKGWTTKTIGELCDSGGGKVQTGPFGSQLHESDYSEIGIPFVMPKDIIEERIDETRIARVSEAHVERLRRHKLEKGDIIYGRRGDIGRQAIVHDENVGWLCGSGCIKITLGQSIVLPEFLHRYLQLPEIISWIEGQAIGATMANLNTNILRRVPITYPVEIGSQRRIAAILSAYDELIENNKRRIALLEKAAEEIYREWFIRFRFPGYKKVKTSKRVPEGWQEAKLGALISEAGLQTGKRPKGGAQESGIPSIGAENVTKLAQHDFEKEKHVSEQFFDSMRQGRVADKDVLFYKDGAEIGRVTLVQDGFPHERCCVNEHVFLIRTHNLHAQYFLYFYLSQPLIQEHVKTINKNAAQPGINKTELRSIPIVLPKSELITEFETLVSPIISHIFHLAKAQRQLAKTRDTLLPRLVSGKLSVENLDIQFPPGMAEL